MFRGIDKFRKMICLALSVALIAVQSGCYTMQRVRSVDALAIPNYEGREYLLRQQGSWVRVFYYDGRSITTLMGKLKVITSDEIIITTSENKDVPISMKYIQKINIYDKKFDEVATVMTGALVGVVLLFFIAIGLAHPPLSFTTMPLVPFPLNEQD